MPHALHPRHRNHHTNHTHLHATHDYYRSSSSFAYDSIHFVQNQFAPPGGRYSKCTAHARTHHLSAPCCSPHPRAPLTPSLFSLLTVELVLLAVAFMTCLVMWVLARLLQPRDDYAAVSSGESMVAASQEASYRRLRNLYLSVYALATFGDWIQGGFLYALYAEYGFSMLFQSGTFMFVRVS